MIDPHTAVAVKVAREVKEDEVPMVVLSTASPYKFSRDVYGAIVKGGSDGLDDFAVMAKLHAMGFKVDREEMNKISKITTRSTLASAYIEEQKTRGKDEITENLGKKMYGAITSFKEKYTMIQPNREQLLMSIKI